MPIKILYLTNIQVPEINLMLIMILWLTFKIQKLIWHSLARLSVRQPGLVTPLVAQTEPKVQEFLKVYMQNANVTEY